MKPAASALPLPATLDEDGVRRLCGAAVFARADALQRAGHVLGPTFGEDGLTANVRGTWRRVDQVTVQARGARLQPTCARDGAEFCRHVGALLLQLLRDPSSVATIAADNGDPSPVAPASRPSTAAPAAQPEPPIAELARLLDHDTVARLREIARRRGLRPASGKKADLIRQLASELAEPTATDAAIAALNPDERLALDAVHLVSTEAPAQPNAISEAFRALGGSGEPPVSAAHDAGLLVSPYLSYYGLPGYTVPRAVAARLPPLAGLARRVTVEEATAARGPSARLGIVELLQVIALESLADGAGGLRPAPQPDPLGYPYHGYVPAGFAVDPAEAAAQTSAGVAMPRDGFRLWPQRLLADADLDRLAARTGQPAAAVDFAVRLMLALEIAQVTPRVTVRSDRLQTLLDLAPAARLATLGRAWLAIAGPSELGLLAGADGRLRLRWHPTRAGYGRWVQPMQPAIAAAARLVARLVGRLAPEVWYDLGSFVESVERLAPAAAPRLAQIRHQLPGGQALSLSWTTDRGEDQPLALRTPEGWSRFLPGLVTALLTGPLGWLGFAETVVRPDRSRALRVPRSAGLLADRAEAGPPTEQPGHLVVEEDLVVLVPAGTPDLSIHGHLARVGELIDASADGLRYRLTPAGIQAVFDTGTTGPEFAGMLAERAGGTLPPAVGASLDRWWTGYGAIRLYDELTLIELGDDLLLPELLAATSLAATLIHTFSPRLIAIPPDFAEEIVAALTARGYAPRVVEEG